MPRQIFLFTEPRRFVAGTVGRPGERTFYLQAADATRLVTVTLEKTQVAILADRIDQLLDEVVGDFDELADPPVDNEALEQPIDSEFRVNAMALAWDGDAGVVIIEAQAPAEDNEQAEETLLTDATDGPDTVRVLLSPQAARAFADRSRRVVAAGRPPCPLCGQPLDPSGHVCPRQNGYHRRVPTADLPDDD